MKKLFNFFGLTKSGLRTEVLSGITVALALIPEAVAFALVAGLSPLTGLYAAFVMGIVTSIFGGRPGMISGATGAVALVLVGLAKVHGPEYIFAAVILAGIIQLAAGALKLGTLMRLVPHPVIFGFVNGLAIIIGMSQFEQFKDPGGQWLSGSPLYILCGLVGLAMMIIWGLPKLTKVVPSSLVAILVVWGLVALAGIETKTVGDIASISGGFPPFHIPAVPFDVTTLAIIFPYAAIVAGVGLLESLLTLNILDEITETRGNGNREALAQGSANVLSGLFSGMGGCAMIGQSLINISSGARERLSGTVAALCLLSFVMFGAGVIEMLPMAALIGVMLMVAIGTFEWASLRTLNRMPRHDIFVMVIVTVVTAVLHNLALAVLIGVVVASLVFSWDNAIRIRARKRIDADGVKHYEIYGPLFFGAVTVFNTKFDVLGDPDKIVIDFAESRVVDMSAIEALHRLTKRYSRIGKIVEIRNLSKNCADLLRAAEDIIDVNVVSPEYKEQTSHMLAASAPKPV